MLLGSVERCTNHSFELADHLCRDCGRPFCKLCIVKPFRRKPPLCHHCAVAAAGIRTSARTAPVRTRREIKAFERERRQADSRPESTKPGEGGFDSAKPAITSGPSRTTSRAAAERKEAEEAEEEKATQQTAANARNRPLWGLAR